MIKRTWVILGATSIIAEEFAKIVAKSGNNLRLVGRDKEQLEIIAADIVLRYKVLCEILVIPFTEASSNMDAVFKPADCELDLFIAQSDFTLNSSLNNQTITDLIHVNILATSLFVHNYLQLKQENRNIIYLSSVAACFGRPKNSLYGASKAAIEIYLEGLQFSKIKRCQISIIRLGFIDTKQTYGQPGIFLAASPQSCAKACWKALQKKKNFSYYPRFWRLLMRTLKIYRKNI